MFHTQSCLCSFSIPFPADPSLTNSAVLSCLETVEDMYTLHSGILQLFGATRQGNQTREAYVQLYLQTSPYASWEHLTCRLFMYSHTIELYGSTIALEKVKKRMKPVKGQYSYVLYTIQPCRGSYLVIGET